MQLSESARNNLEYNIQNNIYGKPSQTQNDLLNSIDWEAAAQRRKEAAQQEAQANTPRYQQWFKQKAQYDQQEGQPRLAGMVG